jgi:hypothetical protein
MLFDVGGALRLVPLEFHDNISTKCGYSNVTVQAPTSSLFGLSAAIRKS